MNRYLRQNMMEFSRWMTQEGVATATQAVVLKHKASCADCRLREVEAKLDGETSCVTCGVSPNWASTYAMPSRVRVLEQPSSLHSTRTWSLGSHVVIKEVLCSSSAENASEVRAATLLKANTRAPVPEMICQWQENDTQFIVEKRIPGESLEKLMCRRAISPAGLKSIASQIAKFVYEWRKALPSTECRSLEGGPVNIMPNTLIEASNSVSTTMRTDRDVWEYMFLPPLKRPWVTEGTRRFLRETMPPSCPFVFSHLDLRPRNIMVERGRVVGITNFEYCAYWPAWFEQVAATLYSTDQDFDFYSQGKLHEQAALGGSKHALAWWTYWKAVQCEYASADVLQELRNEIVEMTAWQPYRKLNRSSSYIMKVHNAVRPRLIVSGKLDEEADMSKTKQVDKVKVEIEVEVQVEVGVDEEDGDSGSLDSPIEYLRPAMINPGAPWASPACAGAEFGVSPPPASHFGIYRGQEVPRKL